GLQLGIEDLDHAAPFRARLVPAKAKRPHQILELHQAAEVVVWVSLGKFHEKHGFGIAAHDPLDRRPEHRYLARQAEHGAIDEFDRHRRKLDEMLRGVHRLKETAEMASAERAAAKHRRKLQLDAGRKRKRAFGADENMREVDIVIRREIEIVTAGKKRVEI